ncbi:transcriptional regulator [Pseudomonas protegens]|uniref:transcriptional regulator n=1 Tax=Pseudomonas protegens TaxID=380021 RepID=UPI001F456B33|nr:YdaS family helix-turn-helix protein [Pseudomonas protegens]
MRTKHTRLLEWLKAASDEAVAATGTTRGYLRQIAYGNKLSSAEIATSIEFATGGAVTRQDLRPDDWSRIWPELSVA